MSSTVTNTVQQDDSSDGSVAVAPALQSSEKPRKPRDPWPDNVRILAAIAICSIHFADKVRQPEDSLTLLWFLLWGARVPVFVLIAGYFSKAVYSKRLFESLVRNVAVVFVVFTVINGLINVLFGKEWRFPFADPYLGLWFLVSLVIWRVALPVIVKIPYYFVWSILAAAGFGFLDSLIEIWPITRTFSYLPMFLVGYWLSTRPDFRMKLHTKSFRLGAIAFIAASWVVIYLNFTDWKTSRFGMKWAYNGDTEQMVFQMFMRLLVIAFGVLFAFAVMSLVPRGKIPVVSALGSGSFYVYLLHPLIIRILDNLGVFEHVNTMWEKIILLVFAIALALFLASPPVRKVFRPLIQPRYSVPYLSPKKKLRVS